MKRPLVKGNQSGQLSVFAVLIFQVLFILFAMSLNVALVIHDKINLQNSVDLAAYYGAMKQAQMLNAIAHINYQIRQSWKLLAWRNKVLGNIGTIAGTHSSHLPQFTDEQYKPQIYETDTINSNARGYYVTCIAHDKWYQPNNSLNDNLCIKLKTDIPALRIGSGSGHVFIDPLMDALGSSVIQGNAYISRSCNAYARATWTFVARLFLHWILDQTDRKHMIYKLAEHLKEGDDIDDLSIEEGVRKTLKKNLSTTNNSHVNIEVFNSLKDGDPRPEDWLKDPIFYALVLYTHFAGGSWGPSSTTNVSCDKNRAVFPDFEGNLGDPKLEALKNALNNFLVSSQPGELCVPGINNPCNLSAGLYKDPKFIIFYGVKAEVDYGSRSQIFLPFSLKLKAKAFAKPFGGRIGPPVQEVSSREINADGLLPRTFERQAEFDTIVHRAKNGDEDALWELAQLSPNYSRYPGDELGLRSHAVQSYWSQFLIHQNINKKNLDYYLYIDPQNYSSVKDILAAPDNAPPNTTLPARDWEIAAIAPDLFDVTYFTILPSFMQDYYPKIEVILERSGINIRPGFNHKIKATVPPPHSLIDYQVDDDNSASRRQENVWISLKRQGLTTGEIPFPRESFFYKIQKLDHLMAGWNPLRTKYKRFNDYGNITETDFASCYKWDREISSHPTKGKIANSCIYGGRTGYSVKMVSGEFIKDMKNSGAVYSNNKWPEPQQAWWW